MKKFYPLKLFLIAYALLCSAISPAQCPAGWNGQATLKWDSRNYLVTTGNYAGFVTSAMSTSQNFMLGVTNVNIAFAGGISTTGQNITNTGNGSSYGTGMAVQYANSGTIVLTFDTVVANLKFSLYDIDNSQTATVTATDPSSTALNITMANASGSGVNTISGSGTTSAMASASATAVLNSSNNGTVNVDISGFTPGTGVKTVTITMGGTAGDFWLSDITACVYSAFPTNYYIVSKPYTGQPAYILANSNNYTASEVAVATGTSKYVFQDHTAGTTNNKWLNSFGYDPYSHYLYYTYDGCTTSSTNKAIKKYDFNTLSGNNATMSSGTISTILADVTTLGIPIFDQGLESAGCAFYNGDLYIGVEGSNKVLIGGKTSSSNRYTMIWRIDFNSSGVPVKASQAFAALADNGNGTLFQDWGDFVISNGILYDFNSAGSTITTSSYIHYNLQSGTVTNTYFSITPVPGQVGVAWNEQVYWLSSTKDSIAQYNYAGSAVWASKVKLAGAVALDWSTPGAGDGSEAFKPPLDYGDAPASYDPVGVDPAVTDYDSTLRFGTYWNAEFAEKVTTDASGDGVTDDGIISLPIYTHHQSFYNADVKVYNHTGASVTVVAWIDFNNDGVFQSSEGVTAVLATSNTSQQNVHLTWVGEPTISSSVNYVFMRLRLAPTAAGMTTASMNGYFASGEVEDYKILVDDVLGTKLISFKATPGDDDQVNITWTTTEELNMDPYLIEKSKDGINWLPAKTQTAVNSNEHDQDYQITDANPFNGTTYYRLRMQNYAGIISYSAIVKVEAQHERFGIVEINPNPFLNSLQVTVSLKKDGSFAIRLLNHEGKQIRKISNIGNAGMNEVRMDELGNLPKGIYIVEVLNGKEIVSRKIIKE